MDQIREKSSTPVVVRDAGSSATRAAFVPVGNTTFEVFVDLLPRTLHQSFLDSRGNGIELSDRELIAAAERAGTFAFWDSPEDDLYNDLGQ